MGSISGVSPTATEMAQQRLHPVALGKAVDEQHHRHHHQHEADEHPGNGAHSLFKGGLGRLFVQLPGQCAQHGVGAHRHHHCRGKTAHHAAAQKREVRRLDGGSGGRRRPAGLFHRLTLASEGRLAHEQVPGGEHPHIGGDHVSGAQMHHIAHNDLFQRDLLPTAGPLHAGGGVQHAAQPRRSAAAAGLLHETQHP